MKKAQQSKNRGFLAGLREFLHGMWLYDSESVVIREKAVLERLLFLTMFGNMMGVPVLNQYYSLRLLPYMWPAMAGWKRALLREKDWTDWAFD